MADFAELLKRHRNARDLTQEELSERASLSRDAVSSLERGLRRAPYRRTVGSLADALGLDVLERLRFEDAAERARRRRPRAGSPGNVPPAATSFIGRDIEVAELARLLDVHRAVTVVGPGGIGKTRIALEVVRRRPLPPDGAWLADVASLGDRRTVAAKVAAILALPVGDGDGASDTLAVACGGRRLLLILDGCEAALGEIAALVAALRARCPNVAVICTSRQRLGLGAETVYRLGPLPVPRAPSESPRALRDVASVRLFCARAATADPRFTVSDESAPLVASICARVDGIPLAIELAAARLPAFGLRELRAQLHEHGLSLGDGGRDVPERHRTLTATLTWSHDLLGERERVIFRRLAIFAGGWSAGGAQRVCADDRHGPVEVREALAALVEASLVTVDLRETDARYRFFDTTRAFALDRLGEAGEGSRLARAHADHIAALAEKYGAEIMNGAVLSVPIASLLEELDNARSALAWTLEAGNDPHLAARIVIGLRTLWFESSMAHEFRGWAERIFACIDEERDVDVAARLHRCLIHTSQGTRFTPRLVRAERALERVHDRVGLSSIARMYAYLHVHAGRFAEAAAAAERATALLLEDGATPNPIAYAGCLCAKAYVLMFGGDVQAARTALAEAMACCEESRNTLMLTYVYNGIALTEYVDGSPRRAAELTEYVLDAHWTPVGGFLESHLLCSLAGYRLALDDVEDASAAVQAALESARGRHAFIVARALYHVAAIAALRGQTRTAAHLLGYADAWGVREDVRCLVPPERGSRAALEAALRERLGSEGAARALAEGAQLTEWMAVAQAQAAR